MRTTIFTPINGKAQIVKVEIFNSSKSEPDNINVPLKKHLSNA